MADPPRHVVSAQRLSRDAGQADDRKRPPEQAGQGTDGTVPAYLTSQLANYQAALSRLTGGG
jgi:hypothetical protein